MKNLESLPEVAEKGLGGLIAGQELKYRILNAAREEKPAERHFHIPAWVPAVCCALVLAVGMIFALPQLTGTVKDEDDAGIVLRSQRAGEATSVPQMRGDLPAGAVKLSKTGSAPSYRSIWEDASNGSFPMVGVNGRYYRMLSNPTSIGSELLGGSLGTVEEFTSEPALSNADSAMSNKVAQGETIYPISGMDGTLVAAAVDGSYRVFQRVGFNGSSVKGNESLADTLQVRGHVMAVELSGVGTITDQNTAESLVDTLLDNASFESSGSVSGSQSLLIQLDNGITVQMAVKDDKLSACGTWSCPEFIDAFTNAMQ